MKDGDEYDEFLGETTIAEALCSNTSNSAINSLGRSLIVDL